MIIGAILLQYIYSVFLFARVSFDQDNSLMQYVARSFLFCLFVIGFFSLCTQSMAQSQGAKEGITDEGARIYKSFSDALYQIQVIDLASGKKTSIGSGFQFSAEGLVATNYHVIAEALQRPQENKLEYLKEGGKNGALSILYADVINDVAIVKLDQPGQTHLKLGHSQLAKGARIFSLGNPHDIGLTLIEGTFNGLSNESFIDKIHFSGSLNPGMSGGPALNHLGEVIGINVATAGNQISFLIPVERLHEALSIVQNDTEKSTFITRQNNVIGQQLLNNQQRTFDKLLNTQWESVPFDRFMVPGRIHDAFKCWGGADHRDEDPYTLFRSSCTSKDRLFLDSNFTTGIYSYNMTAVTARDGQMLTTRFWDLYSQILANPIDLFRNAGENDVTNFTCENSFVTAAGIVWKASLCLRRYKKYPELYDAYTSLATTGTQATGFIIHIIVQGVSKDNALAFTARMLRDITPQEMAATP